MAISKSLYTHKSHPLYEGYEWDGSPEGCFAGMEMFSCREGIEGEVVCKECGRVMFQHGWHTTLGLRVCPGDFVLRRIDVQASSFNSLVIKGSDRNEIDQRFQKIDLPAEKEKREKVAEVAAIESFLKSLRIQDEVGNQFRPILLRVMTCKDGKPPRFGDGHIPELLRYIADDEETIVEDNPWMVVAFAQVSIFK